MLIVISAFLITSYSKKYTMLMHVTALKVCYRTFLKSLF